MDGIESFVCRTFMIKIILCLLGSITKSVDYCRNIPMSVVSTPLNFLEYYHNNRLLAFAMNVPNEE